MEYGRGGQNQEGLDVRGYRDGNLKYHVSIQCRRVRKDFSEQKIRNDCDRALAQFSDLKELIFATTLDDDRNITDTAVRVQQALIGDGKLVRVVVYGWDALCNLIAQFPDVMHHWRPSLVPPPTAIPVDLSDTIKGMAASVNLLVAQQQALIIADAPGAQADNSEDPALHATIDSYRDLLTEGETETGLRLLTTLLGKIDERARPWAFFRVQTNIGKALLDLGRNAEAATYFEKAFDLRPRDGKAVANKALAQLLRGEFETAQLTATEALKQHPTPVHAIGYLLQAAARTAWDGPPEDLVPQELLDTEEAAVGLAEFKRIRQTEGWQRYAIEASQRHEASRTLRRMAAFATLAIVADVHAEMLPDQPHVTLAAISAAADELKVGAETLLRVQYGDVKEAAGTIQNAAMMLRLADRIDEAIRLLQQGIEKYGREPGLVRMLAVLTMISGNADEAIGLLDSLPDDPESQLMAVEGIAHKKPEDALTRLRAIDPTKLEQRHQELRLSFIVDISLRLGDQASFDEALRELKAIGSNPLVVQVAEFLHFKATDPDKEALHAHLRQLAGRVGPQDALPYRYSVAEQLRMNGLPAEASRLLEGHVDLSRANGAARFYLDALAEGRRDQKFIEVLAKLGPTFQEDPSVLWTEAHHAYETGDLLGSLAAVERYLGKKPTSFKAHMLKVELFVRLDRSDDLRAELDHPLEGDPSATLPGLLRLVALLGHFGYSERAAALAYRLYLSNRDNSAAWMAMMGAVIEPNKPTTRRNTSWDVKVAGPDAAIDVSFDDGEKRFFVVESNPELLRIDFESVEEGHEMARSVAGKKKGDTFRLPDGRTGKIKLIRHKYVARLHYVMAHHEKRFPTIMGVRSFKFDPKKPGGMDEVIEQCRLLEEHKKGELDDYKKERWPLRVLAYRLGQDVIETASTLSLEGIAFPVDPGTPDQRNQAARVVREAGQGCVVDLATFWTAWKLGALETIQATVGKITVARSTYDHLRARADRIASHLDDGLKSLGSRDGKPFIAITEPEVVAAWNADILDALKWLEDHAEIAPVRASDHLPDEVRKFLLEDTADFMADIIVAQERRILLLCDDASYRVLAEELKVPAAWLHSVLSVALRRKHVTADQFIHWTARLSEAGQVHIGITEGILLQAALRDIEAGVRGVGWTFEAIAKQIGGSDADRESHLKVVIAFLEGLWSHSEFIEHRAPLTGHILRRLLSGRQKDYLEILGVLVRQVVKPSRLNSYLRGWVVGHFVPRS